MKWLVCINTFALYKLNDCIFDIMLEMWSAFVAQIKKFLGKLTCGFFSIFQWLQKSFMVKIGQNNREYPDKGIISPISD